MAKALARRHEKECGGYDWDMIRSRCEADKSVNDIGDYAALVNIEPAGQVGRGLCARSTSPAGSATLAEKAYTFARGINDSGPTTILVEYDLSTSGPEVHSGEYLVRKTIFELRHTGPKWRQRFFELYSGGYGTTATKTCSEVDGQIVIDSVLVRKTIRLRSMSCGPASQPGQDCGIWIMALYVIHSCDANCDASFFGNMPVLRPGRNIGVGEQLTLNYIFLHQLTRKERRKALKDNWGFDCACRSCLKPNDS